MIILLVEDDGTLRGALKDTLEFLGYKVIDAAHGPQALTLLRKRPQPIDLVISDLVMPHMNAFNLVAYSFLLPLTGSKQYRPLL